MNERVNLLWKITSLDTVPVAEVFGKKEEIFWHHIVKILAKNKTLGHEQ